MDTESIFSLCVGEGATMMEIDHEAKQVYREQMRVPVDNLGLLIPTEESLSQRLTTPIVTTFVDTDKISFERFASSHSYQ